jgi:hypothetical protein
MPSNKDLEIHPPAKLKTHFPAVHWPLLVAAALLLLIVSVQLALSLRKNEGHFVYALDDAYIHMAIAHNFASQGVWGVTRYEFSSSTSSLLWTLLLTFAYLFTTSHYVPLLFNIAFAILLLIIAHHLLDPLNNLARLVLLVVIVLLVPLPALIFSGMEHTAHLLLSLSLVFTASSVIAMDHFSLKTRRVWLLLALATLATMVRAETLFLILPIAVLLTIRRRVVAATLVITLALLPLAIYGVVSVQNGSEFISNPLLLKGSTPRDGMLPFLIQGFLKLVSTPHLLLLLVMAVWLLCTKRGENIWQDDRLPLLILIPAIIFHTLFAGIGWFYRYEAYLIVVGLVIVGRLIYQLKLHQKENDTPGHFFPVTVTLTLALITGMVMLHRANGALWQTIPAMRSIHNQHYQMARFLRTYYSGQSIAANDIGAINFMADIRCLDLRGLGSVDVTRAKLAGAFDTEKIAELAARHQVRIALLYSVWFQDDESLPRNWLEVGRWTTRDCVVCGNPTVSFYAVDKNEANRLLQNLQAFSAQLPADVIEGGSYHETR